MRPLCLHCLAAILGLAVATGPLAAADGGGGKPSSPPAATGAAAAKPAGETARGGPQAQMLKT